MKTPTTSDLRPFSELHHTHGSIVPVQKRVSLFAVLDRSDCDPDEALCLLRRAAAKLASRPASKWGSIDDLEALKLVTALRLRGYRAPAVLEIAAIDAAMKRRYYALEVRYSDRTDDEIGRSVHEFLSDKFRARWIVDAWKQDHGPCRVLRVKISAKQADSERACKGSIIVR